MLRLDFSQGSAVKEKQMERLTVSSLVAPHTLPFWWLSLCARVSKESFVQQFMMGFIETSTSDTPGWATEQCSDPIGPIGYFLYNV